MCDQGEELNWKYILAEMVLHCIVLPPRVNAGWRLYQLGTYAHLELSDAIFVLGLARLYHLYRAIYWMSGYTSRRGMFYSTLQGVIDQNSFVRRSFLKKHGFFAFLLAWGVLNITGALFFRTFDESVPNIKVDTLWSAIWAVVVAETTIGYGDITPLTHISRLTIIAAIACGMGIYAFVIMNAHRASELSPHQHLLYGAIHYAESYKKLRLPAALMVQRWWKYYQSKWMGLPSLDYLAKFNFHIRTFRLMRRKFLSLQTPLLAQTVFQFENDVTKRLFEEITRLQDIQSIENLVNST